MKIARLIALACALLGGISCGGGPCGSHVVLLNTVPGDGGLDCSVCGYPVISCNLVTVNTGDQNATAVSCNIANECP